MGLFLRTSLSHTLLLSQQAGKRPIDLIIDFLSCLWEYAKDQITKEIGAVADLSEGIFVRLDRTALTDHDYKDTADVWLTVPAAWDARGCDIMREAAITAGLVASSRAGDTNWKDRLRIITEPEAAAVHCAQLTNLHHLKPSQNFIVCDAGGGTVDLAVYKVRHIVLVPFFMIMAIDITDFFVFLKYPLLSFGGVLSSDVIRSLVKWRASRSPRWLHVQVPTVGVFSLTSASENSFE